MSKQGCGPPSVPESVKKDTRAVLLSSTKGVALKRFSRDYKSLTGSGFPWKKCGFPTAVAMLQAMPDVVTFQFSPADGDYRLYGKGTKDMFMPSWVVKAQGLHLSGNRVLQPNGSWTRNGLNVCGSAMMSSKPSPPKNYFQSRAAHGALHQAPHPHAHPLARHPAPLRSTPPPFPRPFRSPPYPRPFRSFISPPTRPSPPTCPRPFRSPPSHPRPFRSPPTCPHPSRSPPSAPRPFRSPPTYPHSSRFPPTRPHPFRSPPTHLHPVRPPTHPRPFRSPPTYPCRPDPACPLNPPLSDPPSSPSPPPLHPPLPSSPSPHTSPPPRCRSPPHSPLPSPTHSTLPPSPLTSPPPCRSPPTHSPPLSPSSLMGPLPVTAKFQYNLKGLVTLLVSWPEHTCQQAAMESVLKTVIEEISTPVEIACKTNKAFVRFKNKPEAERVMQQCHGMQLLGTHLSAWPAHEKMPGNGLPQAKVQGRNSPVFTGMTEISVPSSALLQQTQWDVVRDEDRTGHPTEGTNEQIQWDNVRTQYDEGRIGRPTEDNKKQTQWDTVRTQYDAGRIGRPTKQWDTVRTQYDEGRLGHPAVDTQKIEWDTIRPEFSGADDMSFNLTSQSHDMMSKSHDHAGNSRSGPVHVSETLKCELGLMSDDDDDDSLADFEWDEAIFDDLIASSTTSRPEDNNSSSLHTRTTSESSSSTLKISSANSVCHMGTPRQAMSSHEASTLQTPVPLTSSEPLSLSSHVTSTLQTPVPPSSPEPLSLNQLTRENMSYFTSKSARVNQGVDRFSHHELVLSKSEYSPSNSSYSDMPPLSLSGRSTPLSPSPPPHCLVSATMTTQSYCYQSPSKKCHAHIADVPESCLESPHGFHGDDEWEGKGAGLTPVTGSRVVSPDEVWLQLTPDPEKDLSRISHSIVLADPPRLKEVKLGGVCCVDLNACPVSSRQQPRSLPPPPVMRRAVITDAQEKHVGLFLLDVGVTRESPIHALHSLPLSLHPHTEQPLAYHYRIGGVVSTQDTQQWSFLDTQLLWKYLNGRKVFMRPSCSSEPEDVRETVDLFFDPECKESVAARLVKEGFFVAYEETAQIPIKSQCAQFGTKLSEVDELGSKLSKLGTKPSQVDEPGTRMESRRFDSIDSDSDDEDSFWDESVPAVNFGSKKRSLMDFVTASMY